MFDQPQACSVTRCRGQACQNRLIWPGVGKTACPRGGPEVVSVLAEVIRLGPSSGLVALSWFSPLAEILPSSPSLG